MTNHLFSEHKKYNWHKPFHNEKISCIPDLFVWNYYRRSIWECKAYLAIKYAPSENFFEVPMMRSIAIRKMSISRGRVGGKCVLPGFRERNG